MNNQMMDIICIDEIGIPCRFLFPETRLFFKNYILKRVPFTEPCIYLGSEEMKLFYDQYPANQQNAIAEIKLLIPLISDWISEQGRLLIHGVAFVYKEKAWILTAPSGTGKTTQYLNLDHLYGTDVQIICGDNPVLRFVADGRIMVCPSPWNGKERFGSDLSAELGGIILLKQGKQNVISHPKPSDIVIPLLRQIMTFMKTEMKIHEVIEYERQIITSIPMASYTNDGSLESSIILLQEIDKMLNL